MNRSRRFFLLGALAAPLAPKALIEPAPETIKTGDTVWTMTRYPNPVAPGWDSILYSVQMSLAPGAVWYVNGAK